MSRCARRNHIEKASLSDLQAAFVREYLIDLDCKQAALRAGYRPSTANVASTQIMRIPQVAAAVDAEMEARARRLELTADRILKELMLIAFSDIGETVNADGTIKSLPEMPEEIRRAIRSHKVGEDGVEVDLESKLKALELCMRHKKMLTDKMEHSADSSFAEMLKAARERAAKR